MRGTPCSFSLARRGALTWCTPCRVAGGQNTTFILARPNDKFSDLPRHPLDVNPPDICVVCDQDTGDDDAPLECDKASSDALSPV